MRSHHDDKNRMDSRGRKGGFNDDEQLHLIEEGEREDGSFHLLPAVHESHYC